jgi:hypothetical protein
MLFTRMLRLANYCKCLLVEASSVLLLLLCRNEPQWGVELVNDPPATDGLLASFRQTHTYQAPGLFHVLNDQGKGPMAGEPTAAAAHGD